MYKASLIISIYDNVDFLRVIFDSLKYQTEQNFEIIISEDANHPHVKQFVETYPFQQDFQHLTQEDKGWQKNKALNRAILASKSDWLIFIDGDCVLHPRFIEFHVELSAPKRILSGKRVKLNPQLTNILLAVSSQVLHLQSTLRKMLFGKKKGVKFIEEGIFINPNGIFGLIPRKRKMRHLTGSNMSFSKKAIMDINGFDEDYVLPAFGEDRDLSWRFVAAGYHHFSVRNLAVQYHLYHKENWQDQTVNTKIGKKKQESNSFVCLNGIRKL